MIGLAIGLAALSGERGMYGKFRQYVTEAQVQRLPRINQARVYELLNSGKISENEVRRNISLFIEAMNINRMLKPKLMDSYKAADVLHRCLDKINKVEQVVYKINTLVFDTKEIWIELENTRLKIIELDEQSRLYQEGKDSGKYNA